jgi:CubicO group peptidase (beta-lactamase class C family)
MPKLTIRHPQDHLSQLRFYDAFSRYFFDEVGSLPLPEMMAAINEFVRNPTSVIQAERRRRSAPMAAPRTLLLLRVFGFDKRTQRRLDDLGQRWRYLGPIRLIGGADLAYATLEPHLPIVREAGPRREDGDCTTLNPRPEGLALRPCRPLEASPIVLRTPTSVLEQLPGVDRMLNGTLRSRSERICDANQEATSTMKQLFSLVALVLFSAQALNPQVNPNSKIPDTPAGKKLAELLAVLESGNSHEMRSFAEGFAKSLLEKNPVARQVNLFQQIYDRYDGLKVYRIEKSSDYEIAVLVESRNGGEWRNLRIETEPTDPYQIRAIDYGRAPPPADAPSLKKLSEAELIAALEAFVQRRVEKDQFSGTVLVAKDGQPIFKNAYGLADKKQNIPNRIDTKFNLGSCNKMFTALAIAQLAETGKLSFEDPIVKYLPQYSNKEVAEKVKIHHLLTHSSGLGFYPFSHGSKSPEGILKFFVDKPLSFEPGARMQYSNAGFVVLGLIIERVSGQNYYDYIRENIYQPVGMTDTDSYSLDERVSNRAVGYTNSDQNGRRTAGERRENYPGIEIKGSPAGGGYSTVQDMLKFANALRNNQLLNSKYTEILLNGKQPMGPDVKYAYGFGDHTLNGQRYVGHGGGAPGINAEFKVFLTLGYTIVVFANYDPPAASVIADEAARLVAR